MKPQNLSSYVTRVHFNLPQEKCFVIVLYLSTRLFPLIQSVYEYQKSKEAQTGFGWKTSLRMLSLSFIKIRSRPDGMSIEATFLLYRKDRFLGEFSQNRLSCDEKWVFKLSGKSWPETGYKETESPSSPCDIDVVPLKPIFKWPDKIFFEGQFNGLWINEWMRPLGTVVIRCWLKVFCRVFRPICKVSDDKSPWKLGIHQRPSEVLRFKDDFLISRRYRL